MGRGLSQPQRQILGIAVHANRRTQGGTLAVKTGAPVAHYRIPTVDYGGIKDLQWPLPAHLLQGLPIVCRRGTIEKSNGIHDPMGNFLDLSTRQAKSAKASMIRAFSGWMRLELLILAPQSTLFRWDYVLTEAGLRLGIAYEQSYPPVLLWCAGMLI
jgi:hypothetical protein